MRDIPLFEDTSTQGPLVVDVLFEVVPKLKSWIEKQNLYKTLIEHSASAMCIVDISQLNDVPIITELNIKAPRDLPLPLVLEFYKNSPYFTLRSMSKIAEISLKRVGKALDEKKKSILN